MNEPKKIETLTNEKPTICQFYIVLGHHDRNFQNDDENRYFPLSGNEDIDLIQYALSEEWKKKKKEHIKVANEIIFLIPDLSYKDLVKELMDKLNCRGKFQIIRPKKIEEPVKKEPIKEEVSNIKEEQIEKEIEKNVEQPKKEKSTSSPLMSMKEQIEKEDNNEPEPEITIKEPQHIKEDNIYRGEIPRKPIPNIKPLTDTTEIKNYMWSDEENTKLTSNKKERKIDLPVIIFIIATLLLIGAIVVLVILK